MSRMKDPFANEADHDEGRGVDPMSFVAKPALRPQVDVVEEITRAATADGFKTNSPKRRRAKAARLPFSMRLT